METVDRRVASWAAIEIASIWPDAKEVEIAALKGDASTRRFFRITIAPGSSKAPSSAVVVDLGPQDLPLYARELKLYPPLQEPPWINLHRFLSMLRAPVPSLYQWSSSDRLLMVEDVGSLSLFEAARANPAKAADLYRDAVSELMRFHIDGTAWADRECVAFQIAYDERLFAWEMRRFLEIGLAVVAPNANPVTIEPEIAIIARALGELSRVFSHRDFYGNNLFVQDGRLRVIDFQDALMAPRAQDLAVLMTTRDTASIVSPALEERLLDFYFTGLIRRGVADLDREDFLRSYRLCVLQHALKCIGLFVFLESEGKHGYDLFIPHATSQARRMLDLIGSDFPRLRKVFAK
ncbi:MAG TPA: phosphotransferase [Candidatus Binataceae bacterium]|nr:phosphotransferase [Candidatus Binataceae bacterium]